MERSFDSSIDIIKEQSDYLYEKAGELVDEEENQISLTEHNHLLNDHVATILEQVLEENPLHYSLQDFQKLALHAIGSLKNVILISPTGSGKMIVAYLAIPGKLSKQMVFFPLETRPTLAYHIPITIFVHNLKFGWEWIS